MKLRKTIRLLIFSTAIVLIAGFLSFEVTATNKPEVDQAIINDINFKLEDKSYISPVFETDFSFNIVGMAWQGDENIRISIRYKNGTQWSRWYSPESDNNILKDGWRYITEPIIADHAEDLQYKVTSDGSIEKVKLIYLGTSGQSLKPKWNFFNWFLSSAEAEESLNIITREEWEADEEWRFDSDGDELWEPEYQWPEKFVLHHTAGSDGSSDPEGTIRGVYYWHAVVLGWGDIGYNYIIDQEGNIYEGRSGGDGVIGAHVYRSATCAKSRFGDADREANFNKGTVGIAVLGDYQTSKTLNAKVRDALVNLIGEKSVEFEIDPSGSTFMFDDTYPNVSGHRDIDCTDCPGEHLYSKLDVIRSSALGLFEELGGAVTPIVKATYVGQSDQPVSIGQSQEKQVWVEFRNTGNITWRNYSQNIPSVIAKNTQSRLYLASGETEPNSISLVTPNVAPGEVGRFMITITGPEDALELSEEFALQIGDTILKNTTFTVTAQVTGIEYAGVLDNQQIIPAMFTQATQQVTIQFKNRGTEPWSLGDIKLNIYDLGDEVSRFYHKEWNDEYGQINFVEAEVKSGELATFTFSFVSPAEPGLYYNRYELVGDNDIVQEIDRSITRVDSTYQAELVEHNIPPAMHNTWRLPATVTFKNVGVSTWDRSVTINAYDLNETTSQFYDGRWISSNNVARLVESSVKPGEVGTFEFLFNAPDTPGLYFDRFVLKLGSSEVQGSEFTLLTRVDE